MITRMLFSTSPSSLVAFTINSPGYRRIRKYYLLLGITVTYLLQDHQVLLGIEKQEGWSVSEFLGATTRLPWEWRSRKAGASLGIQEVRWSVRRTVA